jgi:formylglycine-generating enzyme required for sulfatase activity
MITLVLLAGVFLGLRLYPGLLVKIGANSPSELLKQSFTITAPSHPAGELKTVDIGSQTIRLHWCPAGSFMMGSPTTEEGRYNDETHHEVKLTQGLWMGETEVTQGLWEEVMDGNNPSCFKSGGNYPVENVSWDDCQEFLQKLNARTPQSGLKWALPTEEQWEYACRAGSTTAYFWGDALNGDGANCDGNYPCGTTAKGPYKQKTMPVRSYAANAWDLYDMHGNVLEWCSDWYGEYPSGPITTPAGPASGRVIRGGSWYRSARDCRSASRDGLTPGSRNSYLGFRVALVSVP